MPTIEHRHKARTSPIHMHVIFCLTNAIAASARTVSSALSNLLQVNFTCMTFVHTVPLVDPTHSQVLT